MNIINYKTYHNQSNSFQELNQLKYSHHLREVQELCLETLENVLLKHFGEDVSMIQGRSNMDKPHQQISDLLTEP